MATLLTVPVIISVGSVSTYLAANDNSVGDLFGKRLSAPTSANTIAIVTDALNWQYTGYSSDTSLQEVANYLLWLCGVYGQQAQYIVSGAGGGTVSPIAGANPSPLQFYVSTTSFITTGSSSKAISNFSGYNLQFVRGGIPQSTLSTESSYYIWDKINGNFTCVPAAQDGELFQLYAIS